MQKALLPLFSSCLLPTDSAFAAIIVARLEGFVASASALLSFFIRCQLPAPSIGGRR